MAKVELLGETKKVFRAFSNKKKKVLLSCRCAICDKCWYDTETNRCIYGGPYDGYERVEGKGAPPQ